MRWIIYLEGEERSRHETYGEAREVAEGLDMACTIQEDRTGKTPGKRRRTWIVMPAWAANDNGDRLHYMGGQDALGD